MAGQAAALWRVATFNIRHGLGPDGRVDLARTAREIAALGADVIGLQEVDAMFGSRSDHEDQPARLAELLGMQSRFGAALDLPPIRAGAPRRRYGVALLTRHEILSHSFSLLPAHPHHAPPAEPRGLLRAVVRGPGDERLEVLVTHLDNAEPAHRTAQVQGIVRLCQDLAGPALLMGDMNAEPSDPELAALAATGWRDAAEAAREIGEAGAAASGVIGPSGAAGSVPAAVPESRWQRLLSAPAVPLRRLRRLRLATHPARFPVRRIDSLWVRGDIGVSALAVAGRGSSDHRGTVATVHLTR